MTEKKGGRWKPGQSGNPRGRAAGSGDVARLRAGIAEHVPAIIERLVDAAKEGDIQAARILLERVLPPMKAAEQAVPVKFSGETLTDRGRAVLEAVEAGALAPGQAAALLSGLGTLARVAEVDELMRRVEALEGVRDGSKDRTED